MSFFRPEHFSSMMGGSLVQFQKRDRLPSSQQEREQRLENERKFAIGIEVLRKIRTAALREKDPAQQQHMLQTAHHLSEQMATAILRQCISEDYTDIPNDLREVFQTQTQQYQNEEASSGHGIPPSIVVHNLFNATEDMLSRIEKVVGSTKSPSRPLTEKELLAVCSEFLIGTNMLSNTTMQALFHAQTRVGGILTGGAVYLELVKQMVEGFDAEGIKVNTFVVAVDKENQRIACEKNKQDFEATHVVLTDDMIDGGGTMLTALCQVGATFPNARISSGKGVDAPGGFEKRRQEKHYVHLGMEFQDFADLVDEHRYEEALTVFKKAEAYAQENNTPLTRGWFLRKAKIPPTSAVTE